MKKMIKMMAAVVVFAAAALTIPVESMASVPSKPEIRTVEKSFYLNQKLSEEIFAQPNAKPLKRYCPGVTEIVVTFTESTIYFGDGSSVLIECTGVSYKGFDNNCAPIASDINWDCEYFFS